MSWSNRDRDASTQIHFSSNIFVAVAVAVVVSLTPYFLMKNGVRDSETLTSATRESKNN